MFGGTPGKKAENFWPSFKRLMGLLKPEWLGMAWVTLLTVVSVVLVVIAPKILGNATDVIFKGVIGSQLPKGVPVDQVIAQLRASGQNQLADVVAGSGVTTHQGIDFTALGRLLLIVLAMYLVASVLQWGRATCSTRWSCEWSTVCGPTSRRSSTDSRSATSTPVSAAT